MLYYFVYQLFNFQLLKKKTIQCCFFLNTEKTSAIPISIEKYKLSYIQYLLKSKIIVFSSTLYLEPQLKDVIRSDFSKDQVLGNLCRVSKFSSTTSELVRGLGGFQTSPICKWSIVEVEVLRIRNELDDTCRRCSFQVDGWIIGAFCYFLIKSRLDQQFVVYGNKL